MRRQLPRPIEKPQYEPEQAQCSICPYQALGGRSPCKPRTQSNSRFLVILDQPDPASVKHGELRTTASQKLLEKSMASCGATDVSYLYATACRRPEGASDKDVEAAIQACAPRLQNELNAFRGEGRAGEPFWVLSLGDLAFRAATGKTGSAEPWRGSPVVGEIPGTKVIASWDPYQIGTAKGSRYAAVWVTHLDRYVKLATGQLPPFEWPEVIVDEGQKLTATLEAIAQHAEAGGEVSTDIETRGLGLDSAISCMGFSCESASACVQLPASLRDGEFISRILRAGVMVSQNGAAFDRRVLARAGYELTPRWDDTMLAASILDPQLDKNLGFLVNAEFHAEAHKAAFKTDKETGIQQGTWDSTDPAVERERREYCLKDAYTTLLLWQRQKERFQTYGQAQYEKLKRKAPIANAMRSRGMPFDYRYQAKMKAYHEGKREKIRAQMRAKLAPILPDFNPGSTKQVGKLFYNVCKIAPFAWTPEGTPSTDEDAIIEILKSDNPLAVECADKILEYRNHDKMLGTYVVGGAPVDDSGLVFGDWKCHTAVSGRWSCTKYRLPDGTKAGMPFQVIPARIRRLFRAREGMEFCEGDYKSLEICTLALLSGARHLLQMLADGVDLHLTNARQMFNDPSIVKKSPLRQAAKVIAFSSHYGAGPDTVWRTMIADDDIKKWKPDLTVRQVQAMQNAYFKIHADIPAWWKRNVEEAQARGYLLEPVFGRRLAFYGPVDFSLAQNFPNQSLGAEIIDAALIKVYNELEGDEGVIAQIHDSLCLEGPDGQRLKSLLEKHMPTTLTYEGRTMHFPIECKVSDRYVWVK